MIVTLVPLLLSVSDPSWRWVWATPDFNRATNSRIWSSEFGTANLNFQGQRFSTHLENENHNPAYDLKGNISAGQVKATATPTDADPNPRTCTGKFARDKTSERIDLICEDGAFIGLIRDTEPNRTNGR